MSTTEENIVLSPGEWKLINLLWAHSPRTITQMVRALTDDTGWSKYTVIKMLQRMEEKGAVRHEEGGPAKAFFPVLAQQAAELTETEAFLDRVYGGSLGLMMSVMVRGGQLSRSELNEIYLLLRETEEEKPG